MTRLLLALLFLATFARAATMEEVTVYSGTVSATGDIKTISLGPIQGGVCVVKTTAVSGSGPTLDLYLQSVVGGVDDDYCRFAQITGTGSQIVRFGAVPVTTAAAVTPSDLSSGLSASACRAGTPGARLKVAGTIGGTGSPSVTITLTCHLLRL